MTFSQSEHHPSPSDGKGRKPGRGEREPPGGGAHEASGMLFLTLLSAGVLLLRLRQAGVVPPAPPAPPPPAPSPRPRLAQSIKPEPRKSEADGHGSPGRSAVGVGGLGNHREASRLSHQSPNPPRHTQPSPGLRKDSTACPVPLKGNQGVAWTQPMLWVASMKRPEIPQGHSPRPLGPSGTTWHKGEG